MNFKIKRVALLMSFLAFFTGAFSKSYILADKVLTVSFNDQTHLLTVTDKRSHKTWVQEPLGKNLVLVSANQQGKTINLLLKGKGEFRASIQLNEQSELEYSIAGDNSEPIDSIAFPSAFKTPNKAHALLLTDGGGLLLPANDEHYPLGKGNTYYCGGGLAMAWMGMVDERLEGGYMAILETPFDAALHPVRNNGLISFDTVWLPSIGKFGYDRHVKFVFFDKGGYVAQCKRYREYIWPKNKITKLSEHAKNLPAINKMVGAVHMYVWDDARTLAFAQNLKNAGIKKAFILWDPNHNPYPEKGFDEGLKDLGYASGVYDLYADIRTADTAQYTIPEKPGSPFLSRTSYPGQFRNLMLTPEDGNFFKKSYNNLVNPIKVRPELVKRVDRELKIYPHDAYFLDVWQANGLQESFDKNQPLSRKQYAEAVLDNMALLESKYHVFVGGEWGCDYAVQHSIYNHGMMTLQHSWFNTEIGKKGSIYWIGDWSNNARPSQMLTTRVAPPLYLKYSINENLRVPLYELVYHDAEVSSWRWEDGNNQTPAIWWKKDLYNILYGSAPLWILDKAMWDNYKADFVASYQKICPWLQQVGYDEMLSHQFLIKDRSVQATYFSSGKCAVVNFGDTDFKYKDQMVKAKGFLIVKN